MFKALPAQNINITSPDKNRYYYKTYSMDTFNVEPGNSGKGMVWDFSQVAILDSSVLRFYSNSMDNPFSELFPNSNFVSSDEKGTKTNFLRKEPNCLIQLGSVDIEDSIVTHIAAGGQDTLMNYPLYYGKKWEFKTTKEENNTSVNANAPHAIQYIQGTFEVDGEGIIILPNNKQCNALRLHTIINFDGYAYDKNPKDYSFNKVTHRERYQWFIQELPVNDVFYINNETIDYFNPKKKRLKAYSKKSNRLNMPLDVNTSFKPNSNINLTISDNNLTYTLTNPSKININIFNTEGKVVKHIERSETENNIGTNSIPNELQELVPGMYIVALYSEYGTDIVKWIKK